MPLTMEQMEKEIIALHDVLESRGINSRKTQDIFGRTVSARAAHCTHTHARAFLPNRTRIVSPLSAAPRETHASQNTQRIILCT